MQKTSDVSDVHMGVLRNLVFGSVHHLHLKQPEHIHHVCLRDQLWVLSLKHVNELVNTETGVKEHLEQVHRHPKRTASIICYSI